MATPTETKPDFEADSIPPEPVVYLVAVNGDRVAAGLIHLGGAELAALIRRLAVQERVRALESTGPMIGQSSYSIDEKFIQGMVSLCELPEDVLLSLPTYLQREKGVASYTLVISQ